MIINIISFIFLFYFFLKEKNPSHPFKFRKAEFHFDFFRAIYVYSIEIYEKEELLCREAPGG